MAILSPSTQSIISFNPGYLRAKRLLDILFTLLILLPLSMSVQIVTVLIRLDSTGPAFFRQRRVDLNGKEFEMFSRDDPLPVLVELALIPYLIVKRGL